MPNATPFMIGKRAMYSATSLRFGWPLPICRLLCSVDFDKYPKLNPLKNLNLDFYRTTIVTFTQSLPDRSGKEAKTYLPNNSLNIASPS